MPPGSIGNVEFRGFGKSSDVRWSNSFVSLSLPPSFSYQEAQIDQNLPSSARTDIGDFVHQAARVKSFHIALTPPPSSSSSSTSTSESTSDPTTLPLTLEVLVPSFSARTHFLRSRLGKINEVSPSLRCDDLDASLIDPCFVLSLLQSLRELGDLKALCDKEARRGARRVALGGLGGLLAYWAIVAKLSFDPAIGWVSPPSFSLSLKLC